MRIAVKHCLLLIQLKLNKYKMNNIFQLTVSGLPLVLGARVPELATLAFKLGSELFRDRLKTEADVVWVPDKTPDLVILSHV